MTIDEVRALVEAQHGLTHLQALMIRHSGLISKRTAEEMDIIMGRGFSRCGVNTLEELPNIVLNGYVAILAKALIAEHGFSKTDFV